MRGDARRRPWRCEEMPGDLKAVPGDARRRPRRCEEQSRELPRAEIRLFMSGWARFDPEAAFEYALFAPEVNRHTMASALMYTWAQGDPVAAQGALLGVRNTSLGRALEEHFILGQISVGGLELVHEYTEDLRPSKRRELLVGHIAQALAMQSADTVIDWAEAVDDDDSRFRRTVFNKTAGALAQYNHERGVEWVVGHYGEPDARGSARLLALRWADSDPDAAFAWLSSLPGGEEKNDATGFVFAYWLNSRPEEASAWLAQRDHGVALDPAMRTMALSKIAESPPVAIEWARRVHDSGIRERTLVQIAKAWLGSDPEAARRWLAASGLPRSARKNVLGGSR